MQITWRPPWRCGVSVSQIQCWKSSLLKFLQFVQGPGGHLAASHWQRKWNVVQWPSQTERIHSHTRHGLSNTRVETYQPPHAGNILVPAGRSVHSSAHKNRKVIWLVKLRVAVDFFKSNRHFARQKRKFSFLTWSVAARGPFAEADSQLSLMGRSSPYLRRNLLWLWSTDQRGGRWRGCIVVRKCCLQRRSRSIRPCRPCSAWACTTFRPWGTYASLKILQEERGAVRGRVCTIHSPPGSQTASDSVTSNCI